MSESCETWDLTSHIPVLLRVGTKQLAGWRSTRLSHNLRPTTRECARLVTRDHLQSCDKDRYAIAENPVLYANFTALVFFLRRSASTTISS